MKFLLDTNVPKGFLRWLILKGHQAEHVLDIGLAQAIDPDIWKRAADTNAVVISKDEDFADIVRRAAAGPAVVWLRTGNGTTKDLLGLVDPLWPSVEERLAAGDRLIEVR